MVKRSVREGGVKVGEEKMWAWAKTSWDICSKERGWLVDHPFYGLSWRILALKILGEEPVTCGILARVYSKGSVCDNSEWVYVVL